VPLRARVRPLLLPATLLAVFACSHSASFQDPDETNQGPFSPSLPAQLTYNPGPDVTPVFLPGDSLLLYSYRRAGALTENQCIGALPVAGGTTISESCPRSAASLDSTERYENPVPLDDSLIVLVQSSRRKGNGADAVTLLGTAPWRAADHLVPRLEFPFPSASGVFEISASYLSLLGGGELAYLAMVDVSACPGTLSFCDGPSLIRIGREAAQLNLQGSGDPIILAGTDYATSVATGRTPGSILLTLPFDSRVYERQPGGSTVTLFDFGEGTYVRDPVLVGGTLVAIVGGEASRWTSSDGVALQVDDGGDIALVNLASGAVQLINGSYKRPALSADGHVLIAELITGEFGNLYRIDLQ
jgi:hypothetical protein